MLLEGADTVREVLERALGRLTGLDEPQKVTPDGISVETWLAHSRNTDSDQKRAFSQSLRRSRFV